ncbi:MAG TPA: protein kinase [Steroidobacteraceae bacterium]|nr:protein kinase [Steroidobacteraceae bacterium]
MSLSQRDMARLGELLDEAMTLTPEQRFVWLDSLPEQDHPLLKPLRESLLSDDPASALAGALDRMPRIDMTGDPGCVRIERHSGERLGAYELLRPLGAGGMAEVWLAIRADGTFEREVALKIPHLRNVPAQMKERFARECRILATLEAPDIARLYDAGVDATGAPYVAMEYVQGQPLVAWCDARGLDTPARIRLFLQVLDAVGYAHRRQVLHRDLKPSNILVTEQGEVRLLDFGVARLLRGDTEESSVTQSWGRALTPAYASPELLRGDPVDLRSDIYSLGVVLHELLTGVRPGQQPLRAAPGSHRGELAGALRDAAAKALAPDPADRYADAAGFAEALRPFSSADAARAGFRRSLTRPRLVAGFAALALLVAGGIVLLRSNSPPAVQTIAVLPLANLTGDPEQEILADGLAEELANRLAAIPELRVTGRNSAFSFKGKNEDLRAIASKLGVSNLLEGSLRGDDGRLRVNVQLIDGKDGTRRWSSQAYEHEQSGILAAQDQIAQDVARALSVTLDVGALTRAQGGTRNLEAARRYWEWREMLLDERFGLEDQRRSLRLIREAVRLDPEFILAWDMLAITLQGLAGSISDTQPEQAAQMQAEAEQALSYIAKRAPDSWIVLSNRSRDLLRAGQWAEAEAVARQVVATGPLTFERAYRLGTVLFATGRINESIELQAQVLALEPRAMWVSRDQQFNLYAAGRFDESEAEYQRSRTLDGNHTSADLLAFQRGLARPDADLLALREWFLGLLTPQDQDWRHDFGAAMPDREEMLAVLRRSVEAGDQGQAMFADALGDRDLALNLLRTHIALERGKHEGVWYAPWLLVYSGARADPRFKELMREVGLADFWRKSGKWPDSCGPVGEDDFECH